MDSIRLPERRTLAEGRRGPVGNGRKCSSHSESRPGIPREAMVKDSCSEVGPDSSQGEGQPHNARDTVLKVL
jgi:hypothetical protein